MLRMLCVDDNDAVHSNLAHLIKLLGKEVKFESSTTYHEAVGKVMSKHYDAIFIDICIHGEGDFPQKGYFSDGVKFAEHIRSFTSAKIIACTGYGLDSIDGRDSFDGILLKPVGTMAKELSRILEEA